MPLDTVPGRCSAALGHLGSDERREGLLDGLPDEGGVVDAQDPVGGGVAAGEDEPIARLQPIEVQAEGRSLDDGAERDLGPVAVAAGAAVPVERHAGSSPRCCRVVNPAASLAQPAGAAGEATSHDSRNATARGHGELTLRAAYLGRFG